MAKIKSFTDIEQSKKLAEILLHESADMCYIFHASSNNPEWRFDNDIPPMVLGKTPINEITVKTLPCWSLASLLDVLERGALFKTPQGWICHAYYIELKSIMSNYHSNPVDACYEMILKLHELKML